MSEAREISLERAVAVYVLPRLRSADPRQIAARFPKSQPGRRRASSNPISSLFLPLQACTQLQSPRQSTALGDPVCRCEDVPDVEQEPGNEYRSRQFGFTMRTKATHEPSRAGSSASRSAAAMIAMNQKGLGEKPSTAQ